MYNLYCGKYKIKIEASSDNHTLHVEFLWIEFQYHASFMFKPSILVRIRFSCQVLSKAIKLSYNHYFKSLKWKLIKLEQALILLQYVYRHVWTVPKSMLQCSFGSQETRSQWWNQLTDNLKTLRECRECLMVYHSDILPMDSFWSLETVKTKKLSKWSPCFVIDIQYWCLS